MKMIHIGKPKKIYGRTFKREDKERKITGKESWWDMERKYRKKSH